ncbi:TraB/GumN family protein [Aurantiacibacter spongiae]|uniref:TraB/GumN family protein n=1 Tax=Aurantiacibacter spongiae TaxID=2488860 RepID=A0A3N5CSM5_9SPHN|nr:TraB/GumN family protein [Aurantiacibacter spongiae]RPF70320.1 TraB/GumN family protein [Aurantiacibacter spongiae]
MTRARALAILLTITGALWLSGCGAPAPSARDWPAPSPALWEVNGPGGAKGWLFGTVHALPDAVAWRTPLLEDRLARAGPLVVEIADLDDPAGRALFHEMAFSAGQPPLTSRVDAAHRPALKRLMQQNDAKDGDFAGVESWGAALLLGSCVRTGDPANGVDRALIAGADEVIGLESFAGQYAIFDALPAKAQSDLLLAVATEAEAADPDGAVRDWLTGNEAALDRRLNAGVLAFPDLRRALLERRNKAWTARIADLVNDGRRPFVAVGAGHLVGDTGLPVLLRERGFTVRRIQ